MRASPERTRHDGVWVTERWLGRGRCFATSESGERLAVEGALPGERVRVDLYRTRWKRWGVVREVLEPSHDRVAPSCPHASVCPGCALLHTTPEEEDRYKALVIEEVFARELPGAWIGPVRCVAPARRGGHRWRASFAFEASRAEVRVGLRGADGGIVHAPECPANAPALEAVFIAWIQHARAASADDAWAGRVEALEGRDGARALRVQVERGAFPEGLADALARVVDSGALAGAVLEAPGAPPRHIGAWPAPPGIGPLPISGAPTVALTSSLDGWTQPTPRQARDVYAWALDRLAPRVGLRALDVGCATGGLSIALAMAGAEVLGVDVDPAAFRAAERSVDALNAERATPLRACFRGGKAETVLPRLVRDGAHFDVALVNPMRSALGEAAMGALDALGVQRVVYLAPSAMAGVKDLRALLACGFVLDDVGVANLHPGGSALLLCASLRRGALPEQGEHSAGS